MLLNQDAYSHCVHLCGFSLLWVSMCLFGIQAWPNESPPCAHVCRFSPVWVIIMCLHKASTKPNMTVYTLSKYGSFLHTGWAISKLQIDHKIFCIGHNRMSFSCCGFPCVSSVSCLTKWLFTFEQVWVFSPLQWVNMCRLKVAARPNDLWHWTQAKGIALPWFAMCLFRSRARANDLSRSSVISISNLNEHRGSRLCWTLLNSDLRDLFG